MAEIAAEIPPQQLAVLRLVARGYSNPAIGRALFISVDTVKTHIRLVTLRLHARNRSHAVAIALLQGQLKRSDLVERRAGRLLQFLGVPGWVSRERRFDSGHVHANS